MIEYSISYGNHDDLERQLGSVEFNYWTGMKDIDEVQGIDDQFIAQFLGLV